MLFLSTAGMRMLGRVVVYSIVGCPHCLRAKNTLQTLAIPYNDISLDSFPDQRDELKRRTGGKTSVPQIFFNEIYVGGNNELNQLVSNKTKLAEMIEMLTKNAPSPNAPQVPDPSTAVDRGKNDGEFVCEPDEYALLIRDIKRAGLIKDHKVSLLITHKNSFKGQDLIDWIVKEKELDKERAMEIGSELVDSHFGHPLGKLAKTDTFSADGYYRLLEDDESQALNAGKLSECAPMSAGELAELLRRLILNIYAAAITPDGKGVNYKAIAKSEEFEKYVDLTRELQRVDVAECSLEEKLAFFINVYNALVIHGTVKMGAPHNLWQRYKFFNTVRYIIGGETYSLQDIENGVLRGNRKGVGQLTRPFGKNDRRLLVALPEAEPLIHFALNCGAKSCPPIKTFSAKGVKVELKIAAEAFLETDDALVLNTSKRIVKVSQIFKWYKEDFGGGDKIKLVEYILAHMGKSQKKKDLEAIFNSPSFSVEYLTYDWGHNSKS